MNSQYIGEVTTAQMAIPGAIIGGIGTLLIVAFTRAVVRFWDL